MGESPRNFLQWKPLYQRYSRFWKKPCLPSATIVTQAVAGTVFALCWLGPNRFASSYSPCEIAIWKIESRCPPKVVLEKKLTGHTGVVKWVIPFGDECLLSGANDSVVGLWNIESGEMQRIMTGHTGWLNAGALLTTPNDPIQLLVTGSEDGTVRIFRIDTGEKLFQLESFDTGGSVSEICALGYNSFLVGGLGGLRRFSAMNNCWQTSEMSPHCANNSPNFQRDRQYCWGFRVGTLDVIKRGPFQQTKIICASYNGVAFMFDMETGAKEMQWKASTDWILDIIAVGSRFVVTASINKEIAFWDLAEIAHNTQVSPIKVLKNHSDWVRVVRMKDGVMLSGGSDSQIIYWSTPLEEEEDDVFLGDFNVLFSED